MGFLILLAALAALPPVHGDSGVPVVIDGALVRYWSTIGGGVTYEELR